MNRLDTYGVTRKDYEHAHNQLSKQFGLGASINDTIWRILNQLVSKYAGDPYSLEGIYYNMSTLVSREGKDPTTYLLEAANIRNKREGMKNTGKVFLGHDELAYVRNLRTDGDLDKADELLYRGMPSPPVLGEIRRDASERVY